MDWKGGRRSDNVEDRRDFSAAGAGAGLGLLLRLLPFLLQTKMGRGLLLVGVIGYFGLRFLGIDLLNLSAPAGTAVSHQQVSSQDKELVDFVSVVLANTEDTWTPLFQQMGREYQKPKLVLFRNGVSSACGFAQSAMGPFYCPGDNKLYIDLSFYEEMKTRLGAPGDFAQAYVIAHEVGHHVQNLLGVAAKVNQLQQGRDKAAVNRLSVLQELQADCFAGIWGHYADKNFRMIEDGDLEEALNAASAIGDDNLQQQANGRIRPEAFTHGTSKQRMEWFKRGMETGDVKACNTFADTAR
ncbi:MAG TPA: neutral zinc metallopeptidase [Cellvibrio sp.]|nr:neutral zinc metallopeptidase [Cellvibrio sp.]